MLNMLVYKFIRKALDTDIFYPFVFTLLMKGMAYRDVNY